MKWVIAGLLLSNLSFAHQVEHSYQYWWLKGPQKKSFQTTLYGVADLNLSESLLIGASHFERFQDVDRWFMLGFRKKWFQSTLEVSHKHGGGNSIIARRDSALTYASALKPGLSIWGTLKAQEFLTNTVHLATVGFEREWSNGIFTVVSFSGGRATYNQIADTADVWGSQIRVGQYKEDHWKYWAFIARGEEAQALANQNQSSPLQVVSFGSGFEKSLKAFNAGLQLERAYYPSIQTRFESILAYLNYNWGKR